MFNFLSLACMLFAFSELSYAQANLPLLGVGSAAAGGKGAISTTPIHQTTGTKSTGTLNITVTAPANGNTMILAIAVGSTGTVNTISLTGVATWVQAEHKNQGSVITSDIWYGLVGAGAGTALSITTSPTTSSAAANISEWSNILSVSPQDSGGTNGALSSSPSVSFTTVSNNDLVMAVLSDNSLTAPTAFPSGYTQLTSASLTGVALWPSYLVPAASGSQSASWTFAVAHSWAAVAAGFKDPL